MTPLLHPFLVNDLFGDPALYVDFKFQKRALLFDLGDLHALETRKILRLSHVFVSHAHVDHFIGFDQVLRVLLGREKRLDLFGPEGFIDRVEHKLQGYAWNLAGRYKTDLRLTVTEVLSDCEARRAAFRLRNAFRRETEGPLCIERGIVLDAEGVQVRATVLDHRIACLGYAVAEQLHVNVWKNRLQAMGLPVGPWLHELKRAVQRGDPDESPVRVRWREGGTFKERELPLGPLKAEVLRIVPGQKVAYVVDARFDAGNTARIVDLAKGADILFIEAAFARAESARAAERYHLTTAQAGELARLAAVKRVVPFHFSPRYSGEEARMRREVMEAFNGAKSCETPVTT